MKKVISKFVSLISIILILAFCSGCSLNFFSVESLIVPPKQTGKNGEVQKAFNTLMSDKKIQLKTPATGDYQTSFVLIDVNSDDVEEAFVFYTDSSSVEGTVRMAFMECINDEWSISSDVKGAGSGVNDINFVDLNNDGVFEVFVGWLLLDGKTTHIMSAFECALSEDGKYTLNSLGNEYCNGKTFIDFNSDGSKDLVLVYLDDSSAVQRSYLRFFRMTDNKQLLKYGETVLDSSITSIISIQSDVVTINSKKTVRLFVDCSKNDRMIFTELVYWDSNLLVPVKALSEPSISNARSSLLPSSDIDNDGLLEIPSLAHLYGDEKTLTVKEGTDIYTFSLLNWNNVIGDRSKDVITTLLNPMDMYLLHFNWGDKVTVKYDTLRDALIFSRWNETEKKAGDELFSITYRQEIVENEILGEVLYESDNGNYYYQITQSGYDFGVTDETINSLFIKLD